MSLVQFRTADSTEPIPPGYKAVKIHRGTLQRDIGELLDAAPGDVIRIRGDKITVGDREYSIGEVLEKLGAETAAAGTSTPVAPDPDANVDLLKLLGVQAGDAVSFDVGGFLVNGQRRSLAGD